jgi:putative ABC transport system permease protein
VRLSNVVRLYRVRLRGRLVQEAFALSGIAVGVALLFASQVASTSLNGSIQQITDGIVGQMRFQLVARAPEGFDQRLLGQVDSLPGVGAALSVLQARVNLVGPAGARAVDLLGAEPQQAEQAGPLVRRFSYARLDSLQALAVPAPIAQAVGVASLGKVTLQSGSLAPRAFIGATLTTHDIGALADSPIALGPLRYVQRLTGMTGRVTSIFVRPLRGDDRELSAGLAHLAAANALNLRPADFEAELFSQAAGPTDQSTLLFSAISALVGFLFAFNAILLTVPQRRNLVEDLRLDGYSAGMIVRILLFDALVLGAVASLSGLALGELLSLGLFSANPGYLSLGFPVGSQRIVTWQSVAIALGGGVLAAVVGVLAPLRREIYSPLSSALARPVRSGASVLGALIVGVACLAGTTAILLADPRAAIVGIVCLIAALLLLLPVALTGVVAALARLRRFFSGVSPYLAVIELRSRANRARALAIAATGAIAVFGSVAIQGAHSNLQQGLDRLVHQLNTDAQLWVLPTGEGNLLATAPFPALDLSSLRRTPGVSSVEPLLGGLLDYEDRRIWVLGAPPGASEPIPPSQLLSGDLATAVARVRSGGWAVISQALAQEHHLRIGERFVLPSPRPASLRVAGLITNLGWPPGAIILNSADYARAWASADPSAYYVKVDPGVSLQRVRAQLARALGPGSGLGVETSRQRELRQRAASRQGLARLTQISWLVLIAAVLAMGAAMGSMVWQRRRQLADLKVDGFRRGELWRSLLLESALLLGSGCSIGAAFGIYGELLLSHALASVTGFPVVFSAEVSIALWSLLVVTAVAVAIVAVPGLVAARARPALSLQE